MEALDNVIFHQKVKPFFCWVDRLGLKEVPQTCDWAGSLLGLLL